MIEIFSRFKDARKALGYKQEDFAIKLGISQRDVSQIETGKRQFISPDIIQFMHKNGIDLNWLITGEGEMFLSETSSIMAHEELPAYGSNDEAWRIAIEAKNETIAQLKKRIEELEQRAAGGSQQIAS